VASSAPTGSPFPRSHHTSHQPYRASEVERGDHDDLITKLSDEFVAHRIVAALRLELEVARSVVLDDHRHIAIDEIRPSDPAPVVVVQIDSGKGTG
jgi:hypothetical protein